MEKLRELLHSRGVEICGVEICQTATVLHEAKWTRPVAFMLGNEGSGMSDRQKAVCDRFVYIPQYSAATASLNVAVAGGIIFHAFACKYMESGSFIIFFQWQVSKRFNQGEVRSFVSVLGAQTQVTGTILILYPVRSGEHTFSFKLQFSSQGVDKI